MRISIRNKKLFLVVGVLVLSVFIWNLAVNYYLAHNYHQTSAVITGYTTISKGCSQAGNRGCIEQNVPYNSPVYSYKDNNGQVKEVSDTLYALPLLPADPDSVGKTVTGYYSKTNTSDFIPQNSPAELIIRAAPLLLAAAISLAISIFALVKLLDKKYHLTNQRKEI